MQRILYFDLETKLSADEVGGWNNIVDMGMSCGVIYDNELQKYLQYQENQVGELIAYLKQGSLIVGFNHIGFDLLVLAGSEAGEGPRKQLYQDLCSLNHFDIMLELQQRLGHRVNLDSVARATLQEGKSASGLQALQWYREGRLEELMEYCAKDVDVTRRIYEYALEHQKLFYESRGVVKSVSLNWKLPESVSLSAVADPKQGSFF